MTTLAIQNNEKKKKVVTIILNGIMTAFLLISVGALLYPYLSNYLNKIEREKESEVYTSEISLLSEEKKMAYWTKANEYNQRLLDKPTNFYLSEEELEEYYDLLEITGDRNRGTMGHIRIPEIGVSLMIYHTVDDAVLLAGAGHMPGSSLPIGGAGTYTVLSGHRGLTSATLFTNLDKMEVGDIFYLTVLEDVLAYEVYDIEVVLPNETESLAIQPEEDLCTLVTCTPYGINSHRILVHARRVEVPEEKTVINRARFGLAEYLAIAGLFVVVIIAGIIGYRMKKAKHA